MSVYPPDPAKPPSHSTVTTGVLLVNLGTPTAPTIPAVRSYLAEFLSDPRVIDYPAWLWQPILHGVILRTRPAKTARAYARIWTEQGSPLRYHSEALAQALQEALDRLKPGSVCVKLAMRYGQPSIAKTIHTLLQQGIRRLLLLPLYPQYAASSTGAVLDAVAATIKQQRWPPEWRTINDYHAEPLYIEALASTFEQWWAQHGRGDRLLLSFHGLPEAYVAAGDPYYRQCLHSARLLGQRLGLAAPEMQLSFQSRVGRQRWLQPYTEQTVRQLAAQGVKRLDVACPGFAVDCLETLEEIAMQNRAIFRAAGGQELRYIPALNKHPAHSHGLTQLVLKHMQGWV